MSAYAPPAESLPIFDSGVFNEANTPLTISEGSKYFLTFPNAQSSTAENLADTNVNGKLNCNNNLYVNGTTNTNFIQYPDGTKQYTASASSLTPNNITITPTTANPPPTTSGITNYYNNNAFFATNIFTPAEGNSPYNRRQNFVRICWDNSQVANYNLSQNVVIEYKHYMSLDTASMSPPTRMLFYDYGTISFSIKWLYQNGAVNVNGVGNSFITFYPQARGAINNKTTSSTSTWDANAYIQAEYLGNSYNYITLYFMNSPISVPLTTLPWGSWSSFTCEIKNSSNNPNNLPLTTPSQPISIPLWLVPDTSQSPVYPL